MASSLPNCPLFVFAAKYLLKHGGQLCETEQFLWRESSFKSRCWVLCYSWIRGLLCCLHLLPGVRVSNELGSRHPKAAKYSVFVTVTESLLIGILFMSIIMTTRNHFAVILTESKDMQKAVAQFDLPSCHYHGPQPCSTCYFCSRAKTCKKLLLNLIYLLAITMVLNRVQPVISE
ncbi:unnamed protein product [Camellia sinensis]